MPLPTAGPARIQYEELSGAEKATIKRMLSKAGFDSFYATAFSSSSPLIFGGPITPTGVTLSGNDSRWSVSFEDLILKNLKLHDLAVAGRTQSGSAGTSDGRGTTLYVDRSEESPEERVHERQSLTPLVKDMRSERWTVRGPVQCNDPAADTFVILRGPKSDLPKGCLPGRACGSLGIHLPSTIKVQTLHKARAGDAGFCYTTKWCLYDFTGRDAERFRTQEAISHEAVVWRCILGVYRRRSDGQPEFVLGHGSMATQLCFIDPTEGESSVTPGSSTSNPSELKPQGTPVHTSRLPENAKTLAFHKKSSASYTPPPPPGWALNRSLGAHSFNEAYIPNKRRQVLSRRVLNQH